MPATVKEKIEMVSEDVVAEPVSGPARLSPPPDSAVNGLNSFLMSPALYAFGNGEYRSIDNAPYDSIESVDSAIGGDNEYIGQKVREWIHRRDIDVHGTLKAVLDPSSKKLYTIDLVMRQGLDSSDGIIGFVSVSRGQRHSFRTMKNHATKTRSICSKYYKFHPSVVIFRVAQNGALRASFV